MKIKIEWILIGLLIIVILFLLTCNGTNKVEAPVVTPTTTIVNNVVTDSVYAKKVEDSAKAVINVLQKNIVVLNSKLEAERTKSSSLFDENKELISQVENIQLKNDLLDNSAAIENSCDSMDKLHVAKENNLIKQIEQKNKLMLARAEFTRKLRANLNTCLNNQTALEAYSKQIKPRTQLLIGVTANVYPELGYGIASQLRFKSGVTFVGSAMVMNKQMYYQAAILKPISFR